MKYSGHDRLPLLLHFVGQKVFAKLCDYMDDVDLYAQKYDDVIKKLDELFKPKVIEKSVINFIARSKGEMKPYKISLRIISNLWF